MTQTPNYNLYKFDTTDKLNPTTLNGINSNADIIDSALADKPPLDHATTSTTYGLGTSTKYGHCKLIDNLTSSILYQGYALSARQGYLLDQAKEDVANKVTTISASSTDTQYPSAKCVYDAIQGGGGSGGGGVPVGTIIQYDGNTIPSGYEEINGTEIYSTTEQKIGTWINGKPLYEKTLTGTLPSYSSQTLTTDVTIAENIDFVFIHEQFIVSSTGTVNILPKTSYYVSDVETNVTDNSTTGIIYGNTKVYRIKQNSTNANGYTYYARVRYTKTTDSVS